MSSNSEHIKYPSTPTFRQFLSQQKSAPTPLTNATFVGTVKLHGYNTTLLFRPSQPVQIQARYRILTAEHDPHGAFEFLSQRPLEKLVEKILEIRGQGNEYREIMIAGEYAGGHVQKCVALNDLPVFFAVFHIRIDDEWMCDPRVFQDVSLPEHRILNVVALTGSFEVHIRDFRDPDAVVQADRFMTEKSNEIAEECPFALKAGGALGTEAVRGAGEGIVWTLISPSSTSPTLTHFKTVSKDFLSTARNMTTFHNNPLLTPTSRESKCLAFVSATCPWGGRRMEQGIEYLVDMHDADVDNLRKDQTGLFVKWLIEDVLKEEGDRIVEEFGTTEADVKKEVARQAVSWFRGVCIKEPSPG
ncbi:hypothetical protein DL96DRAFT_1614020 [Flagelloscypha sp. PMI_526]|nr:hypothetical protein DL96DRAFT_1614020 [Flagelloscypha sp. PMI_526]